MQRKGSIHVTDTNGVRQSLRNVEWDTYVNVRDTVASGGPLMINFSGADPGAPTNIQIAPGHAVRAEWVPNEQ